MTQQNVDKVITDPTSSSDEAVSQPVGEEGQAEVKLTKEEALEMALEKIVELEDLYKRSLADAENVRKRAKQDMVNAQKYGIERWAAELIEVKDNLERALDVPEDCDVKALRSGVELTLKQLINAFAKVDLKDIEPEKGSAFDPHKQEAMSIIPSDLAANHIVDVLRRGYQIGDRVLRAAQVVISSGVGFNSSDQNKGDLKDA